jgi:ABC-type Zn uptake system ZnuABC Zn-binding protein ZnuA
MSMTKELLILPSFFILVLLVSSAPAEKITLGASIPAIGDLVEQVGGDRVDVKVLLPPGASPHVFEPTIGKAKEIAKAKLFFVVGAGLDFWAERLAKGVNPDIGVVTLSQEVDLLKEAGGNAHTHRHGHAAANPHIWLDPVMAIGIVKKIQEALVSADPEGADDYRRRGGIYIEKLKSLDREIRSTVSGFSIKSFVSFHPAWDYFAERYGLKSAGVIEESPGREPSAKKMESIVEAIRAHGIRAVFAEPQLNPKIAEVIAKEAGVRVVLLDPLGGVPGRETYIKLMEYNLRQMKEAMQ